MTDQRCLRDWFWGRKAIAKLASLGQKRGGGRTGKGTRPEKAVKREKERGAMENSYGGKLKEESENSAFSANAIVIVKKSFRNER